MADYPPYVNAYGSVATLFGEIRKAAVPPKFTQDFMGTVLGLKSSSYRAMIPLLRRLGFIDGANSPTQAYRDYREDTQSRAVMAQQLRAGYADLFKANEFAYKLSKSDIAVKISSLTGASKNDRVVTTVANTFAELCKLADFEVQPPKPKSKRTTLKTPDGEDGEEDDEGLASEGHKLGISYTINLNLPATSEVEVFNAIFKSLKEHILGRQ